MMQLCKSAIANKDLSTLNQFMLKFSYFHEMRHRLTEQDLQQLLLTIEQDTVLKHEPFSIEHNHIYFFVNGGAISRKDNQSRTQKSIRVRERGKGQGSNRIYNRVVEVKQNAYYQIRQFDSFQDITNNNYKHLQTVYFHSSSKPALVLMMDISKLTDSLADRLSELNHDKLRFIADTALLKQLQKPLLQEHLHKFMFLHMKFSEFLYNSRRREEVTFFVKSGSVEVLGGKDIRSGYVIEGKTVLGFDKNNNQRARCVSEQVECYVIDTILLQSIIKKSKYEKFVPRVKIIIPNYLTKTMPTSLSRDQQYFQTSLTGATSTPIEKDQFSTTLPLRKKNIHRSLCCSRLQDGGLQQQRRLNLKKHFSNYYNQIFNQFSEKKIKQMGLNLQNKQNLVLYKIKVLQRKAPSMDEIKHKLKKIRMDKLRRCKQHLQGIEHVRELKNIGVAIMEES